VQSEKRNQIQSRGGIVANKTNNNAHIAARVLVCVRCMCVFFVYLANSVAYVIKIGASELTVKCWLKRAECRNSH